MPPVSGQEYDPFQSVMLQQVLQQRPERQVLVRIDAVKLIPEVADCHDRAFGPFGQFLIQLVPEAFNLIGVRRNNNPVQLFDRGKSKHSTFLGVVFILAGEIPHRGEDNHIQVMLLCFLLQGHIHRVVKQ